jgi:hypothetical protein
LLSRLHLQTAPRGSLWKLLLGFIALSFLVFASELRARGQTAETLSQVKKVYVESFGQDETAVNLREKTIQQLHKNKKLEVIPSPNGADAIIKATAVSG